VPPNIVLRPIDIATCSADGEGQLVFVDDRLAGVLVRLQDDMHADELRGRWFLEAAFGALAETVQPTFATPDEAAAWVRQIWPSRGAGEPASD
jgi:hypothetical protein